MKTARLIIGEPADLMVIARNDAVNALEEFSDDFAAAARDDDVTAQDMKMKFMLFVLMNAMNPDMILIPLSKVGMMFELADSQNDIFGKFETHPHRLGHNNGDDDDEIDIASLEPVGNA